MSDAESAERAFAELHYTALSDADAWDAFAYRHGLEFVGGVCKCHIIDGSSAFLWGNEQLDLYVETTANPRTGEHGHTGDYREEGYCSYVKIEGPASAAESCYRDLLESAVQIKGEFVPLTSLAAGGEVLVAMSDVDVGRRVREQKREQREAFKQRRKDPSAWGSWPGDDLGGQRDLEFFAGNASTVGKDHE